jgi:hypothetical protein
MGLGIKVGISKTTLMHNRWALSKTNKEINNWGIDSTTKLIIGGFQHVSKYDYLMPCVQTQKKIHKDLPLLVMKKRKRRTNEH